MIVSIQTRWINRWRIVNFQFVFFPYHDIYFKTLRRTRLLKSRAKRSISNVIIFPPPFSRRLKIDSRWLKKKYSRWRIVEPSARGARPFPGKPVCRFTLCGIMIGYRLPQTYLTRMQFHSAAVFPQPSTATNGGLRCRRKGFLFPWNYLGKERSDAPLALPHNFFSRAQWSRKVFARFMDAPFIQATIQFDLAMIYNRGDLFVIRVNYNRRRSGKVGGMTRVF